MKHENLDEALLNKVIIVGSNHHNMLGMVRSFGQHGIKPYGIMVRTARSFVGKSKYLEKTIEINTLDEIVETLINSFGNETRKPVVIPVFDEEAEVLDQNYDLLSKKFILPSIREKQGAIVDFMDKQKQYEFAKSQNIRMLPSSIIDLPFDDRIKISIDPPYILKPVASIEGKKLDIKICLTRGELNDAIEKFISLGYSRVLIQHYLVNRKEYCVTGAISPSGGISFSVIEQLRRWPNGFGPGSFSAIIVNQAINEETRYLMRKAAEIGYRGPIDIEFFEDEKGIYYLNEINWRSSGRNFISKFTGVHSTYEYYLECIGKEKLVEHVNDREGYTMNEKTDIHHVISSKDLSLLQWIHDIKRTDSFSIWDKSDIKPAFIEYGRLLKIMLKRR